MCDRHLGIGCDTLLLLSPSDKADFKMRAFDADGSEAEACGNGIRCIARYVLEKGLIDREAERVYIETVAGVRTLKFCKSEGKVVAIEASMGEPKFKACEIPVRIEPGKGGVVNINDMLVYSTNVDGADLALNLVSMGNPHAVFFCQSPLADFPLHKLGPKVENLSIFPNRTNFEVARVISRDQVEARVWERGVGETFACGSGACAIGVAAQLHGYVGRDINIKLPGGILGVKWNGAGEVLLKGPAEMVFTGEWPD
jgi:diaminopimelate epimerase